MSKYFAIVRSVRWLLVAAAAGVYSLPAWGADNGAATVVSLTGQVNVLRDNAPWILSQGDTVQPQQIIVTGPDGMAELKLADGSTFQVFPNSRTVFRNNPGEWRELLDVIIGRVKVHIQKLGGLPNYNKVRSNTAVVSVRGTIFDVVVEDEDDTTLVSVEEGQVGVRHLLKPGGEQILNPGDWVRVFKNQPLTARSVDRGRAVQGALRAAAQALYEVLYRTSRPSGGSVPGTGSAAGGGTNTDKDKGTAPSAPPPAPPPAPPASPLR